MPDDTPRDPLAALHTLVRAVGDYTWLANGRGKDGTCRICDAPEGVMHADKNPCGALGIAMNEARAALATPSSTPDHVHNWQRGYGVTPYCHDCGIEESTPDVEGLLQRELAMQWAKPTLMRSSGYESGIEFALAALRDSRS